MNLALVFVLMVINFAISWFNAWSCGKCWIESKAIGGFTRFMVWCGAIMSACGFTWVYLIVLVIAGEGFEPVFMGDKFNPETRIFTTEVVQGSLALGYLVIIGPILGSGLAITAHSIGAAWKRRTLGSAGIASWNSFAQVYNTYRAIQVVPEALGIVGNAFSSKDNNNNIGKLIIALVVIAVMGGILTTTMIIRLTARAHIRDLELERLQFERG